MDLKTLQAEYSMIVFLNTKENRDDITLCNLPRERLSLEKEFSGLTYIPKTNTFWRFN
ncbi:MAG: hypothetical protein LBF12_06705 [Christensenellaceae bacterium]|nr:hypothetical protein [Christensenellaceae bacterium]